MKLRKYIKESVQKLKKDFLSKLLYDIFKWLLPITIVFANTGWFKSSVDFLNAPHTFNLFWVILYSLILIIATIILVSLIFRKRFKEVKQDNFTDELTGLKNHKALKEFLAESMETIKMHPVSLILIDVDDFKQFNSATSHTIADQLLKKLGELLGSDKRVTDKTFRFFNRGDEFIVVANKTNQQQAFLAAERKRDLIENTSFEVGGISHSITVSCGVTEFKTGDDYDSFTDRVSRAMNKAKEVKGKNCTKSLI